MAFKQSNNPISRKTSPLRAGGFTLSELKETSQAASELSEINSESGNVGLLEILELTQTTIQQLMMTTNLILQQEDH